MSPWAVPLVSPCCRRWPTEPAYASQAMDAAKQGGRNQVIPIE